MNVIRLLYTIFVTTCIVCIVFNESIEDYIIQQYHLESSSDKKSEIFEIGSDIANYIEKIRLNILDETEVKLSNSNVDSDINSTLDSNLESNVENNLEYTKDYEATIENLYENEGKQSLVELQPQIETVEEPEYLSYPEKGIKIENDKIAIQDGAEFLLVGDSLMQGIATTLAKKLTKKGYKVKSLAKQSTGLTYPNYFNWSKAIEEYLKANQNVGILVVCLGANDPWNMKNNIKFKSEEWIKIYKQRIEDILQISHNNNVAVIWYELPIMKSEKYNEKIVFLNSLYKESVENSKNLFITTKILSNDGKYTSYTKNEQGKSVLIRHSDGIHFSTNGSMILSDLLLEKIEK